MNSLGQQLLNIYPQYMHLKIFVDSNDNELIDKYIDTVNSHNSKLIRDIHHIDAGFDLLSPQLALMTVNQVNKLDYSICCAARIIQSNHLSGFNTGFYMYPRSSISKSCVRLANNTGIIDAGYRGHLMGMFDVIYSEAVAINKFDRHLQICAPGLIPIVVEMVGSMEELGKETSRGTGGFGSTGV